MTRDATPLAAGLYLVSTPIGNARDITLRALDILAAADVLAAEDTRSLRRLMDIHGIALGKRSPIAYHEHSPPGARDRLLRAAGEGKSVAYASEAGTPTVADPGYRLVSEAREAGLPVTSAPGASAVLAALAVAGLPTDRFLFAGFPPTAKSARAAWLDELRDVPATLAICESPKRVRRLLNELRETWGPERRAALCRELTKRFEEVLRGTLSELGETLADRDLKGEAIVLVDRDRGEPAGSDGMEDALREALRDMSVKEAASMVAGSLGLPRRMVYQAALAMVEDG